MLCLLIMSNLTLKRKTTKTKLQNLTPEDLGKCPNRHTKDLVIQPSVAQWILDNRNSKPIDRVPKYTNRNLRKTSKKTDLLIRDILKNKFYPSLIKFDQNGWVLAGQHRLYAISQAERACEMIIELGAKRESMVKIDRGQPRSVKDILGLHLFQDWNLDPSKWTLATGIGNALFDYLSAIKTKTKKGSGSLVSLIHQHNPTDEERISFYNKNRKLIEDTIQIARSLGSSKSRGGGKLKGRVFTVPYCVLRSLDEKLADNFMYDMQTQKALSHPAVWIANYFSELEETISAREVYVYHMKKVFGAMQAYIDGKRIKRNVKSLETITIK